MSQQRPNPWTEEKMTSLERRRAHFLPVSKLIVREVLDERAIWEEDTIVEIGAGSGMLASYVDPNKADKIIQTDLETDLLQVNKEDNPQRVLVAADATKLPFPDASNQSPSMCQRPMRPGSK